METVRCENFVQTLKLQEILAELSNVDRDRVMVVRKLKGFGTTKAYGMARYVESVFDAPVEKVYVVGNHDKKHPDQLKVFRSNHVYVLFHHASDRRMVCQAGEEQNIAVELPGDSLDGVSQSVQVGNFNQKEFTSGSEASTVTPAITPSLPSVTMVSDQPEAVPPPGLQPQPCLRLSIPSRRDPSNVEEDDRDENGDQTPNSVKSFWSCNGALDPSPTHSPQTPQYHQYTDCVSPMQHPSGSKRLTRPYSFSSILSCSNNTPSTRAGANTYSESPRNLLSSEPCTPRGVRISVFTATIPEQILREVAALQLYED